jgi:dolichol-phosphate mannosyltransferase|tara:strand:- start:317 stop:1033 length:717 start_codon:yes stop_codon:yes gene_type:complete
MSLTIILPIHNEKESLPIMIRLLNSTLKIDHEIIAVYEDDKDNAKTIGQELMKEIKEFKIIKNKYEKGVRFSIQTGVDFAKYDTIFITAVDEIFPIISIETMYQEIFIRNFDFVSGTRYSKGGARLGGSIIGSFLSRLCNFIFNKLTKSHLTDFTTGIKMMKKQVWNSIEFNSKPVGWAFAFELSIKTIIANYKVCEIPFKSVDRLFGGKSTFKVGAWTLEYLKWFFYGILKLNIFKN